LGVVQDIEREVSNKACWEEGHIERMYPLTANTPVLKIYTHLQGKVYRGDIIIPTLHYVQSQDMSKDTFVCDDCGEEFHVSEEAGNRVCDWCWMVSGA